MKTGFAATAVVTALMATSASAVTLDFAAEGAILERVVEGQTLDFDGLGVTFSSTDGRLAVLDDIYRGRPSGLGVCAGFNPASNRCTPNAEDNITPGDTVTLTFDRMVTLSGMTFRGENHFLVDEAPGEILSSETLLINGEALTFGDAQGGTYTGVTSISFGYGGDAPEQYYVSSLEADDVPAVPVPAAFGLFAGALGLLGIAGRRRRRAA